MARTPTTTVRLTEPQIRALLSAGNDAACGELDGWEDDEAAALRPALQKLRDALAKVSTR